MRDGNTQAGPTARPRRPVDVHVGRRVRLRRSMLGMSQTKLAEAIGLTFQMVQKYERGLNRISASRLYELSKVLDVPISFFFDDMDPETQESGGRRSAASTPRDGADLDPMARRETLKLVRSYYAIQNPNVRKNVYSLIKRLEHHTIAD